MNSSSELVPRFVIPAYAELTMQHEPVIFDPGDFPTASLLEVVASTARAYQAGQEHARDGAHAVLAVYGRLSR
jgi:hypothetical protein